MKSKKEQDGEDAFSQVTCQRDQEGAGSGGVETEDGAYHLSGSHADGLDVKLSTAHVKQIFETRPQEVDDEDVV